MGAFPHPQPPGHAEAGGERHFPPSGRRSPVSPGAESARQGSGYFPAVRRGAGGRPFGGAFRPNSEGVAARHGIRVDTLSLRGVDTVMGGLRKIDDTLSRIPLIVAITAGEAQGGSRGNHSGISGGLRLLRYRRLPAAGRGSPGAGGGFPGRDPAGGTPLRRGIPPLPPLRIFRLRTVPAGAGVPLPPVRRQRQTEGVTLMGPGREARCASRPGPTARPRAANCICGPGARRGGRFSA